MKKTPASTAHSQLANKCTASEEDPHEAKPRETLVRDLIPEIAKYLNCKDMGSFSLSNKAFFLETLPLRLEAKVKTAELIHTNFFFSFPYLKSVQLKGDITEKVVDALAKKMPNLDSLDFSGSDDFEVDVLALFAQRFPGLMSLNLSGCDETTDQGLKHIAGFERLTVLDLADCNEITDQGLAELSKLKLLNSLNLSGCDRITDTGLALLAKLERLSSLNLGGCFDITDNGLLSLNGLENLKSLNLTDCENITPTGVAGLRRGIKIMTGQ